MYLEKEKWPSLNLNYIFTTQIQQAQIKFKAYTTQQTFPKTNISQWNIRLD